MLCSAWLVMGPPSPLSLRERARVRGNGGCYSSKSSPHPPLRGTFSPGETEQQLSSSLLYRHKHPRLRPDILGHRPENAVGAALLDDVCRPAGDARKYEERR